MMCRIETRCLPVVQGVLQIPNQYPRVRRIQDHYHVFFLSPKHALSGMLCKSFNSHYEHVSF